MQKCDYFKIDIFVFSTLCSSKKVETGTACPSREPGMYHRFSFECCVVFIFVLLVFILCRVYLMLPVSLDCSFLIAPSVFCNVHYILRH